MIAALLGNQNAGKTTLFNALTGANQKIGNWPGVTLERKEGLLKGYDNCSIVDLPGIYSLSPYTSEEIVSRDFVLKNRPDLIINIIDATSLERSLYLTTQLLELDIDVVLALNMEDILKVNGIEINIKELSKILNVSIVSISAKKGTGVNDLINLIGEGKYIHNSHKKLRIYPQDIELLIDDISKNTALKQPRFEAVKIIEKDRGYISYINEDIEKRIINLENKYEMDSEQLIASERYNFITSFKEKVLTHIKKEKENLTDRLDRIFLNKYFAIPIFILIMGIVFLLSVGVVGGLTSSFMDALFNGVDGLELNILGLVSWTVDFKIDGLGPLVGNALLQVGASPWSSSLLQDGLIKGVGAVCNFLPQIIILFILLSVLESTGYMSRISFFLDRVFHKIGLSGKSLIPFIVGCGCSVPAIMSSRIIEDEKEKKATIVLTPFIPCSAKLPIIALFSGFFFASLSWLATLSFYLFAIVIIVFSAWVMKKFIYKNTDSTFLSELPMYKLPSIRYVFRDVFDKTWAFIKRAGTIIVLCSIFVWFLSKFTWDYRYVDGINVFVNESMLAGIGSAFGWFFYFMLGGNYSWGASVSAILGLVAKEEVVGSMAVISGASTVNGIFTSEVFSFFNGWNAYAFMTFNLFSAPCIGAISALRKELNSTKGMFKAIGFQIGIAWILASIIGLVGLMVVSL